MRFPRLILCAVLAITLLTPSWAGGQTGGHIGPSNSTVAVVIAAIGAGIAAIIIAVVVVESHHVMRGCVTASPNGPELTTGNGKSWSLEGDSASIKPGQQVKVHGVRARHKKAASGAEVFTVDKLVKDYGPCPMSPAKAAGSD